MIYESVGMTDLSELSWAYRKFKVEAWAHPTEGRGQFILLRFNPLTRLMPHSKHIIYRAIETFLSSERWLVHSSLSILLSTF